jgi:DNA-binding transcriptional ArsR family regulator
MEVRLTKRMEQTLNFLADGPKTIRQVSKHVGETYEAAKARLIALRKAGILDQVQVLPPAPDGSRMIYSLGSGQVAPCNRTPEELAELEARRVQRESERRQITVLADGTRIGPHGGVAHTCDDRPWSWGGQLQGYGPRGVAAILGE